MVFAERIGAILQWPLAIPVVPPEPKWLTALRSRPRWFSSWSPAGAPLSNDHASLSTERTMTKRKNLPARVGRERTCTQCGATYRSPRNSSRYCSNACRMKAKRGTAPTGGPRAGPDGFTIITKALLIAGFVGKVGPTSSRSNEAPSYAVLVPFEHALDELSFQFNRKGWGYVSRDEFSEALKADGIRPFRIRSGEAADRKRWQDCQRQRMNRAA